MIRNRDILNCLPLLASALGDRYGVQVRIGGSKAFTDGKIIHLPSLPLDCGKTAIAMAKGYIDHESAHIRFTDFDCFRKIAGQPVVRQFCNFIEDWRVEKRLSELYPGCKANLAWLIRHVFLEEQKAGEENPAFSVLNHVLLTVRSWDVAELKTPLAELSMGIEKAFPGLLAQIDNVLSRVRLNCSDTLAAMTYAIELAEILKAYVHLNLTDFENDEAQQSQLGLVGDSNDNADTGSQDGENQESVEKTAGKKEGAQTKQNNSLNSQIEADCGASSSHINDVNDLKSLFTKSGDELPGSLGELLAERLQENACDSDGHGLTVARSFERSLEPLPLEEKLAALECSNALRQRLAGLLQAQEYKSATLSRRGRLATDRLYRLSTGNPKIFRKEAIANGLSVAAHILLDASYSMEGEAIMLARQACFAAAKALYSIKGVSPAVTVFPANSEGGVYSVLKHGENLTDRFKVEACGGTPLAPALWWVAQDLYPLSETRKIIVVVTDGVPENPDAVEAAIKRITALGIELYGIGIEMQGVKRFFRNNRVITGLAELAPAIFGLLQNTLLRGGGNDGPC